MARPRVRQGERTVRASFSIQESLYDEFRGLAELRNISQSELFRELLEKKLRPSAFSWAEGQGVGSGVEAGAVKKFTQ